MDVKQVFGCGIDDQIFEAKYESLSEKDKEGLQRVARRSWLTLKLRYDFVFYKNPFTESNEELTVTKIEVPSIEWYLLCTCLDTLATDSNYQDFDFWLKTQEQKTNLTTDEVISLYREYKEAHGVGKNLRGLFHNIPDILKKWLSNNVIIQRSNVPFTGIEQDTQIQTKHLYNFFYNVLRNQFTHNSRSRLTPVADNPIITPQNDRWFNPFEFKDFELDSNKPNQKWNFYYRENLDLATILRIIIHGVSIQKLGIELTEELLNTNLRNLYRLAGVYRFMKEVKENYYYLDLWSKVDEDSFDKGYYWLGLQGLDSDAATNIVDILNPNSTTEAYFQQMIIQYLKQINQLNSAISDFNDSKAFLNARPLQRVKEFLEGLIKTPSYNEILKFFSQTDMNDIWKIVQNPC